MNENDIPQFPANVIIGAPKSSGPPSQVPGPPIAMPSNVVMGTPIPARSFDPVKNEVSEIDGWDKAWENFKLAKDEIELGMWQGMKTQAEADPESFSGKFKQITDNLGNPDFINDRIKANEIDIQKEMAKLKNSSQPDLELGFKDIFTDNFWEEDLPKIMGGMAGLMFEPMAVGLVTGSVAGSAFGMHGTVAGAIGGITAMAVSRPFEGLAEANESFTQAQETLKRIHPDWDEKKLNQTAMKAFDYTFNQNLVLGLKDAAEMTVAFIPFGRLFAPFTRPGAGIISKVATTASKLAYKQKALDALVATGVVSTGEALEELYQHKLKLEAQEVAQDKDPNNITWAQLFDDSEAMYSMKAGFIGGVVMSGPVALASRYADGFRKTQKDINAGDYEAVMNDQGLAKAKLIARAALGDTVKDKNGKTIREYQQRIPLLVSLEKLAKSGAFSTETSDDPVAIRKSSMQHLNKVLIPEIENEIIAIRELKKANPKILDTNNVALLRFNANKIKTIDENLKILDPKLPESQDAIKQLNQQAIELMTQNAEIIKGVDVYQSLYKTAGNKEEAQKPKKEKTQKPVDDNDDNIDMVKDLMADAPTEEKPEKSKPKKAAEPEKSAISVDDQGNIVDDNPEPEQEPEVEKPVKSKSSKKSNYEMEKRNIELKLERDTKEVEAATATIGNTQEVAEEVVAQYPDDVYDDTSAFHVKGLKEDPMYKGFNDVNESIQSREDGNETSGQREALKSLKLANIITEAEINSREATRQGASKLINIGTRRIKYLQDQLANDESLSSEEKKAENARLVATMKALSKIMTLGNNIAKYTELAKLINIDEVTDEKLFKAKKEELKAAIKETENDLAKTKEQYLKYKKEGLKYRIQDLTAELKALTSTLEYLEEEFTEGEPAQSEAVKEDTTTNTTTDEKGNEKGQGQQKLLKPEEAEGDEKKSPSVARIAKPVNTPAKASSMLKPGDPITVRLSDGEIVTGETVSVGKFYIAYKDAAGKSRRITIGKYDEFLAEQQKQTIPSVKAEMIYQVFESDPSAQMEGTAGPITKGPKGIPTYTLTIPGVEGTVNVYVGSKQKGVTELKPKEGQKLKIKVVKPGPSVSYAKLNEDTGKWYFEYPNKTKEYGSELWLVDDKDNYYGKIQHTDWELEETESNVDAISKKLDEIQSNVEKQEDGYLVVDINQLFTRVSAAIENALGPHYTPKSTTERIVENEDLESNSLGTQVDAALRTYIASGKLPLLIDGKDLRNTFTDDAIRQLIAIGKDLRDQFTKAGFTVRTDNIKFYDMETGIGGETDIFLINAKGTAFRILDIKTSRKNGGLKAHFTKVAPGYSRSHKDQYGTQQTIYANMGEKQLGIPAEQIGLIPITMKMNNDNTKVGNITYDGIIDLTFEKDLAAEVERTNIKMLKEKKPDVVLTLPEGAQEAIREGRFNDLIDKLTAARDKARAKARAERKGIKLYTNPIDLNVLYYETLSKVASLKLSVAKAIKILFDAIDKSALTKKNKKDLKASFKFNLRDISDSLASGLKAGTLTEADIEYMAELTGESVDQLREENQIRYNQQMRWKDQDKKVRRLFASHNVDGTDLIINDSNGININEEDRSIAIWDFVQKTPSDRNLRQAFLNMPQKELGLHLSRQDEDMLRTMYQHYKSVDRVKFVYSSNENRKWSVKLSNTNTADKDLIRELTQIMSLHIQKPEIKAGFDAAYKEYAKAVADKTEQFMDIKRKLFASNGPKINKQALDLTREIVNLQKDFLYYATGVEPQYWDALLNKKSSLEFGKQKFNNPESVIYFKGTNVLSSFILKPNLTLTALENNILKTDVTNRTTGESSERNQFKLIADALKDEKNETISNHFKGVSGNFKTAWILKSHLSKDIDRINAKDIFGTVRERIMGPSGNTKVNPWLASRFNKQTSLIHLDGLKNVFGSNNKTVEAGNMTFDDFVLTIINMYRNSGTYAGNGDYLQFVEQQADDSGKVFTQATKYSIDRAMELHAQFKTHPEMASIDVIERDAKAIKKVLEKHPKEFEGLGLGNYDSMSKEIAYNYNINKFFIGEYLNPKYYKSGNEVKQNYKNYIEKVKRKLSGNGVVVGGSFVGKQLKQVTINDPVGLLKIPGRESLNKNQEYTDGLILIRESTAKKINDQGGSIFNWDKTYKMVYSKINDLTNSRTYNKANYVTLSYEFAKSIEDQFGDSSLMKFYEYMEQHEIDFLSFSSGVKKQDDALLNNVEYSVDTRYGNATLKSLPKEAPKFEMLDTDYLFYQQDLQQPTTVKNRKSTRQIWHYALQFGSSEQMHRNLNEASNLKREELRNELIDKTPEELMEYIADDLESDPGNWYSVQLLRSPGMNLSHPKVRSIYDRWVTSKIEGAILSNETFGGSMIEVPNFGIPLKGMRKQNNKVQPAQALVPKGYEGKLFKDTDGKTYAFVTRVPTTDLHSMTLIEVVGYVPQSMGSVIITDQGTQKIAGADNDGDARYLWSPFVDSKGKKVNTKLTEKERTELFAKQKELYAKIDAINADVIQTRMDLDDVKKAAAAFTSATPIGQLKSNNSQRDIYEKTIAKFKDQITALKKELLEVNEKYVATRQTLVNETFDLMKAEYLTLSNFDAITTPIDTDIINEDIGQYKSQDAAMPGSSLGSTGIAIRNNQESKRVIGILARHNAVFNYLRKFDAKLVNKIAFTNFDNGEKMFGDKFLHDKEKSREIFQYLANNLNHATDNGKLGNLEYMGLTEATAIVYSLLLDVGMPQSQVIKLMKTPVFKDFIKMSRESKSPNYNGSKNIINDLLDSYGSDDEQIESSLDRLYRNGSTSPSLDVLKSSSTKDKIETVFYLKGLLAQASKFQAFDKFIKLNEAGPHNYAEHILSVQAHDKIFESEKDFFIKRSKDFVTSIWNKKALSAMDMVSRFYAKHPLNTWTMTRVQDRINTELATSNEELDKNGQPYRQIKEEEIVAIERGTTAYLLTEALNITETQNQLTRRVASWFNSLEPDSIFKTYLFYNAETDRVELQNQYRRKNIDPIEMEQLHEAFDALNASAQRDIASYHVKTFNGASFTSEKAGGFANFISPSYEAYISMHYEMAREKLFNNTNIELVDHIIKQLYLNEPLLIPTVKVIGGMSDPDITFYNQKGMPLSEENPPALVKHWNNEEKKYTVYVAHELRYTSGKTKMGFQTNGMHGKSKREWNGNFELSDAKPGYELFRPIKKTYATETKVTLNPTSQKAENKVIETPKNESVSNENIIKLSPLIQSKKPVEYTAIFNVADKKPFTKSGYQLTSPEFPNVKLYITRDLTTEDSVEGSIEFNVKEKEWHIDIIHPITNRAVKIPTAPGTKNDIIENLINEINEKHSKSEHSRNLLKDYGIDLIGPKYQSESEITLPSDTQIKADQHTFERIKAKLQQAMPFVQVFQDADKFQAFLDKHAGGTKLMMNRLGAAIRNAVYINPNKAVQTTAIHEYAHIYVDALGMNNKYVKPLFSIFKGDEEAMIQSIANAGLEMESAPKRFAFYVKMFWKEVKRVFGFASKKDLSDLLADRMFTNADNITENEIRTNMVKYMVLAPNKDRSEKAVADIKAALAVSDIKDITIGQFIASVNDIHKYTIPQLREENVQNNYRDIWHFMVNKSRMQYNDMGDPMPLSMEQYYTQTKKSELEWDSLIANKQSPNYKKVFNDYATYKAEFDMVQSILWNKIDYRGKANPALLDKLVLDRSPGKDNLMSIINQLRNMQTIASVDALKFADNMFTIGKLYDEMISENQNNASEIKPITIFVDKLIKKEEYTDWSPSSLISGTASLVAPHRVEEASLQARESLYREAHYNVTVMQNTIKDEMLPVIQQLTKMKVDWKRLIREITYQDPNTGETKYKHYFYGPNSRQVQALKNASDKESQLLYKFIQLHFKYENMNYKKSHDGMGFMVPRAKADFGELKEKYTKQYGWKQGTAKAIAEYAINPDEHDEVVIKLPDYLAKTKYNQNPNNIATLKDAKLVLKNITTDNPGALLLLPKRLQELKDLAAKHWSEGIGADGVIIDMDARDHVSLDISFKREESSTDNIGQSVLQYHKNAVRLSEMEWVEPISSYFRDYFGRSKKDNILRWVNIMDDDILYNKKPDSAAGKYDAYIKILTNYTHWIGLGLNIAGMPFNFFQGLMSSVRDIGWRKTLIGFKRMFEGFKLSGDFDSGYFHSYAKKIMDNFDVVNTSYDTEMSISSKRVKQFSNLVFSPTSIVEYINYSMIWVGSLTKQEWDQIKALGKDATAKDQAQILSAKRIDELNNMATRASGAYHPSNKRAINKTPLGRLAMQFKNWLPDLYLAWFGAEMEDLNSVRTKGIFWTGKDVFTKYLEDIKGGKNISETWNNLSDVDKSNMITMANQLVFMLGFGMVVMAMTSDDDKEKRKFFTRALQDATLMFNEEGQISLVKGLTPAAAGTLINAIRVMHETLRFTVGQGTQYENNTANHDAGDYMLPTLVSNSLPMRNFWKSLGE